MLELIKKTVFDFSGIKISTNARNFIERCLTIDPRDRISWSQIYEHPLIKEVDKMIYELSSLRVSANKDFYKKGVEVNKDYIYVERNKEKKKEE
jgi:serine/threonine protein kinase